MILHNPTDTAVKDYPIQDNKTSEVALWSILPGETLDFPEHEGKYLLGVYGFLQRIITPEQQKTEQKEAEKLSKGQQFSQVKIVAQPGFTNEVMQPPPPSGEELKPKNPVLTPADQQSGLPPVTPEMSGAIVGDGETGDIPQAQSTASPAPSINPIVPPKKPGDVICPECKNTFGNVATLKTHYAHKHLQIPGVK